MEQSCTIRPYERALNNCKFCGMPLSDDFIIELGDFLVCYGCFVKENIEIKALGKASKSAPAKLIKTKEAKTKLGSRPDLLNVPAHVSAKPKSLISVDFKALLLFIIGLIAAIVVFYFQGDSGIRDSWVPQPLSSLMLPSTIAGLIPNGEALTKQGTVLGITTNISKQFYTSSDGNAQLSILKVNPPWTVMLYRVYLAQVLNRFHNLGLKPISKDSLGSVDGNNNQTTILFQKNSIITLTSEMLSPKHHEDALKEVLEAL
jgi:hypothetical protein